MILVLGSTGTIGRHLATALSKQGVAFRCAVRNPEKAKSALPKDADIVVADLEQPETIEAAAAGCDKMFLLSGHSPQLADLQIGAIDAAMRAGVSHIVKLSGLMYDPDLMVPAQHRQVEDYLKTTGIDWTILLPSFFMQNLLNIAGMVRAESRMLLPFDPDIPISMIDAFDIARAAAVILTEPGHAGKTYTLAGETETMKHFSTLLYSSLDRSVAYVQISPEQLRQSMERRQTPDWLIEHQLGAEQYLNAGGLDLKSDDFENLVGEPPRSLAKFLSYNVISFED